MLAGKRDGFGVQKWQDGAIYDGNWKNDVKNGYGTLNYANGDVYTGDWKDDMADGYGTYISVYQNYKYEG